MGVKLFVHALRLVLDNFGDAIRISAILYFIPVLASVVYEGITSRPPENGPIVALALSLVVFAASLCVAVAWHRFILLEDRPAGLLPEIDGRRVVAYFGYSLLLGLIVLPIVFGVSVLAGFSAFVGSPVIAFLAALVGIFAAFTIGYRLGLILPASSIDRRLRLGEAWGATRGATWDIAVLAFVSTLCTIVVDLPVLLFKGQLGIVGLLWQGATGWLVLLVGVSILTTLYGHYVEGRPLRS